MGTDEHQKKMKVPFSMYTINGIKQTILKYVMSNLDGNFCKIIFMFIVSWSANNIWLLCF